MKSPEGSGSGAQTLAATRTAGGENLAAAGGGETGAEAVTALAHQFAGLISPLHGSFSAEKAICPREQSATGIEMKSGDVGRPKTGRFRPK
jgi:hypothetical protein